MAKISWTTEQFFTNPGFSGWMRVHCSQCGHVHPSSCDTRDSEEFKRGAAHYGFDGTVRP